MSSAATSSTRAQAFPVCETCEKCFVMNDLIRLTGVHGEAIQTATKIDTCAQCYIANYCSKICQQADWVKHTKTCREVPANADKAKYIDFVQTAIAKTRENEIPAHLHQFPLGKCFSVTVIVEFEGAKIAVTTPYKKANIVQ